MNNITCIRCKGKGQHVDKMDVDGGVITCAICDGRGYLYPVTYPKPLTQEQRQEKMLKIWNPETTKEEQERLLEELYA